MIDCKDLDYCALAEEEAKAKRTNLDSYSTGFEVGSKQANLELLNWFMKLLCSGQTTGMIYGLVKKKRDELDK